MQNDASPNPGRVPHPASEDEASSGEGTVRKIPDGETLDHPVLDGSTEGRDAEREVENPRRGMEDPGLVRHPERGPQKRPFPDEE